jgi:hypothetical protein
LGTSGAFSRWGSRAAAGYLLLLSAAAGYVTYQVLFHRPRFGFPGGLLLSLGLPWTRTIGGVLDPGSGRTAWPILLVSFAINAGMLYFIGSRFEARSKSRNAGY